FAQELDRYHAVLRDRMFQRQKQLPLVTEGVEGRHPETATGALGVIWPGLDPAVRTEGCQRAHDSTPSGGIRRRPASRDKGWESLARSDRRARSVEAGSVWRPGWFACFRSGSLQENGSSP